MTRRLTASAPVAEVRTGKVGNVAIDRHELTVEASRLVNVLREVGLRAEEWFRATDGTTSMPPPPMMGVLEWYQRGVLGLLKEQRLRAALVPAKGGAQLSEEEFEEALLAELAELQASKAAQLQEAKRSVAEARVIGQGSEPANVRDTTAGSGCSPVVVVSEAESAGSSPAPDALFDFTTGDDK